MRPIEAVDLILRTCRQMLHETGREPTPEELAEKLGVPPEKVRKVLKIAEEPILLGNQKRPRLGPTRPTDRCRTCEDRSPVSSRPRAPELRPVMKRKSSAPIHCKSRPLDFCGSPPIECERQRLSNFALN
jgi:hypothetical protein